MDRANEKGALKRFRELFKKKREIRQRNVNMATKTSSTAGITQQLSGEYFSV
jgi:hypothetical protein